MDKCLECSKLVLALKGPHDQVETSHLAGTGKRTRNLKIKGIVYHINTSTTTKIDDNKIS